MRNMPCRQEGLATHHLLPAKASSIIWAKNPINHTPLERVSKALQASRPDSTAENCFANLRRSRPAWMLSLTTW